MSPTCNIERENGSDERTVHMRAKDNHTRTVLGGLDCAQRRHLGFRVAQERVEKEELVVVELDIVLVLDVVIRVVVSFQVQAVSGSLESLGS